MDDWDKLLDRATNKIVDKIRDRPKTEVVDRIRIPGGFFIKVLMVLALGAAVWMFRYEITPAGGDGIGQALVLDRWTGEIRLIVQRHTYDVKPFVKEK